MNNKFNFVFKLLIKALKNQNDGNKFKLLYQSDLV